MLLKQITNPFYILGRIKLAHWEKRNPDTPWMSQDAVRFLEQFLRKSDNGVEFGSGRSTAWFAQRTNKLISIEHQEEWFQIVRQKIEKMGLTNVDYHHIPLDHPPEEPNRRFYDPLPRYVDFINRYENESFDFVIVDGHYRQACIGASAPKIKPGGILILDNSNWLPFEKWGIPDHFRMIHRSENVKSETTLFVKTSLPKEAPLSSLGR